MKNKIRSLKTIYNTLRYNYLLRKKIVVEPSDEKLLFDILDKYKDQKTVFVHIGLGQIKAAFKVSPYEFIIEALNKRFKNIITPGFTPSFRKSGVYHKKYSLPEYGYFSRSFMKDANYRTDDPVYSLLVKGNYRFGIEHYIEDSLGLKGPFNQLDRDNVLCINIGTKWLVSSHLHFIEYNSMVPYIEKQIYEGIIYYDEHNHDRISTINYVNKHWFNKYATIMWNRFKISRDLYKYGVMDYYNINGVKVYAFKVGDMKKVLEAKINKNPYYLIT